MDVYVKNVDRINVYGLAVSEASIKDLMSGKPAPAFMLMDEDFADSPIAPLYQMRDTASHEYNDVLQDAYIAAADPWMLESVATWAGTTVYPDLGSYIGYMRSWGRHPERSVVDADPKDELRRYGSVRLGNLSGRSLRRRPAAPAAREPRPGKKGATAYDNVIKAKGGPGFESDFVDFAASTAEWRLTSSPYPHNSRLPDVRRERDLALNHSRYTDTYDHTAYRLHDVPVPAADSGPIAIDVLIPRGTAGGAALVGRTGDPKGGTATTVVATRSRGGHATVVLDDPGSFSRITAVTVNSDIEDKGFDEKIDNYKFANDDQQLGTLLARPSASRRSTPTSRPRAP